MDRGASTAVVDEIVKSTNSPCYLVELYFDSATVRITDAWRNISWGGNTYLADGNLLGFSGIEETAELQIPSVTLSVSGVNQSYIAVVLAEPYLDRRVVIYKAFLDYTQGVVSSPIIIFDGRLDSMGISDDPAGGTSTVAFTATSQWADFERTPGRHTNPAEQGVYFPGDKFFDYCNQINKQIKWGAA